MIEKSMPFFLVYDNIHTISPSLLICDNLVFMNHTEFSIKDYFTSWIDSLIKLQPYYKVYKGSLSLLFDIFIQDILDFFA